MEPRKESLPGVDAEEPNVEIREPVREPSFLLSPGIVPPGAPNDQGKCFLTIDMKSKRNHKQVKSTFLYTLYKSLTYR